MLARLYGEHQVPWSQGRPRAGSFLARAMVRGQRRNATSVPRGQAGEVCANRARDPGAQWGMGGKHRLGRRGRSLSDPFFP